MFDGFLDFAFGGATDLAGSVLVAREERKAREAEARIAERASLNAIELRGQQINALVLAAVAGVAVVLLLANRKRR